MKRDLVREQIEEYCQDYQFKVKKGGNGFSIYNKDNLFLAKIMEAPDGSFILLRRKGTVNWDGYLKDRYASHRLEEALEMILMLY